MLRDEVLNFSLNLFDHLKIKYQILNSTLKLDDNFDYGLRLALGIKDRLDQFLSTKYLTKLKKQREVLIIEDEFDCNYILIPASNLKEAIILIGPIRFTAINNNKIKNIIDRLSLPNTYFSYLTQYFQTISVINDKNHFFKYLNCLVEHLFAPHSYIIRNVKVFSDFNKHFDEINPDSNPETLKIIKARYEKEQELMEAISVGDINKAKELLTYYEHPKRLKDQLRDSKNFLIIDNTLFRKAAQIASVHPIYLDEISSKFAYKIEMIRNLDDAKRLRIKMLEEYCHLVANMSVKGYSSNISKVINYIMLHLNEDLSLNYLSTKFHINPSYLSDRFKKEVGINLIDFINKKRIEHAVYLINIGNNSLQSIGELCGFDNYSYFVRTFKRYAKITPSAFKKQSIKKM